MPTYIGNPYRSGDRAKCVTSDSEIIMSLRERGLVGTLAWYMSAAGWDLEVRHEYDEETKK